MEEELPPALAQKLSEEEGTDNERATVVARTLMKESDRGCAIFGAAILHDDLERLFRAFFRNDEESIKHVINPLFQGFAPLATFSSRIQLAYAMGLISKDLKYRLDIVRRLRNDFAHESGPIDFDDVRCRDKLRILIADGKPPEKKDDSEPFMVGGQMLTREQFVNRLAFIIAVSELTGRIRFLTGVAAGGKDMK
jgi:DNA-binding MltR family transcriptional regulator